MRLNCRTFVLLVGVLMWLPAHADWLVNTGGNETGEPWTFSGSEYFAGRFDVGATHSINSIEGYFSNDREGDRGNILIGLHSASSNGDVPGTMLFSSSLSVDADAALDWYGVFNLGWLVTPGRYWVSFVPQAGINGVFPGEAPSPLLSYATPDPVNSDWIDSADWKVGVRIDADVQRNYVPEPKSGAVFAIALVALFIRRRVQKAIGVTC